jgi:CO/xanthine dehydrogenase Mo-binding subunit
MVVGPNEKETERLLNEIEVVYEDLPAVLNLRDFDTVFFDYNYGKGDVGKAFAEADKVYEEQFETGYQEQAYLETQGMIAEPYPDKIAVHGSMQCPYYIKGAVGRVMALRPDQVQIRQDTTGGGFGGKEAYPSILACQAAVAARKAGKPVRVIFSRREDMEYTSKRHPSLCTYKVAVKNGKVTAMDIDVIFNAGAYTTLSPVVLQRGIICADGVYNIENLKVRGRAVKTNLVPCGAFRGFGGPQTFFAAETMMDHIADDLGIDSVQFKLAHVVKHGDQTSTSGQYHFPVPVQQMAEEVQAASNYLEKRKKYSKPQTGRCRYGVGMSMCFHGAGFTGSGERDLIKAVARLHKYKSGNVEILVSNADMGQGIKTTLSKIVAKELDLPLSRIIAANPDTDRVPDSGPTVASRSVMIVGELLRRAAIKLRANWAGERNCLLKSALPSRIF